ncbi:hypothetical protein EDC26_105209 [Paralcaligenes ureilyticus]|uniref:Uncharacterized protein n=1 Tax=Paralcaligenes ureilyticus TaxID=627131 RepID=A0A4R3M6N6_9BURK|nr:hypothetical protein EDC26_105209 [Paralcaligenes ureilyticus]
MRLRNNLYIIYAANDLYKPGWAAAVGISLDGG